MTEIALAFFFLVAPAVAGYQSGRATALLLPVALVFVCAQWVVVSDSDVAPIGLAAAMVGVALSAGAIALRRRRGAR